MPENQAQIEELAAQVAPEVEARCAAEAPPGEPSRGVQALPPGLVNGGKAVVHTLTVLVELARTHPDVAMKLAALFGFAIP